MSILNTITEDYEHQTNQLRAEIARLTAKLERYRWIGVEDALPEDGVEVLGYGTWTDCARKDDFCWLVEYDSESRMWFESAESTGRYISHWQPLPLPPAKTGEKGEG